MHDAIKKMYVKTLYFGIASDPEGSKLIEVREVCLLNPVGQTRHKADDVHAYAYALQEYVFNFTYSDGGAVEMSLSAKGKAVNSSSQVGQGLCILTLYKHDVVPTLPTEQYLRCLTLQANVNSVRFQVIRLMRMLVQLCNTLERVPDEVQAACNMPLPIL